MFVGNKGRKDVTTPVKEFRNDNFCEIFRLSRQYTVVLIAKKKKRI